MGSVTWLATTGMVFSRLAGVIAAMPAFGANGVPTLVKVLLALLLAVLVSVNVPPVVAPETVGALVGAMLGEVLLGVLIGGSVRVAFASVTVAAELMAGQMGHGAANLFDPMMQSSQGPLGTLAGLLATLVFLGADLHLALLRAVGESCTALPPGSAMKLGLGGLFLARLVEVALRTGTSMAGPVVILVFLNNAFVAIVTRLAPAMNIFFSLGFLLTLLAGHVMVYLCLPAIVEVVVDLAARTVEAVPLLVDLVGRGG